MEPSICQDSDTVLLVQKSPAGSLGKYCYLPSPTSLLAIFVYEQLAAVLYLSAAIFFNSTS
jgi:hypothetical protein